MGSHDERASIKLTPKALEMVEDRVKKHKQAGIEVSRNAAANELIVIGHKNAPSPTPLENEHSK